PVPALALPVLTTSARTSLFRCLRASTTGAAQNRFCVNTPATAAPGASRITSRSLRPGFLIPAMATPSSTPRTGSTESALGAARLPAMRLGQLAVAVLVFLARPAGTRVVAADLLCMPHSRLCLLGLGRSIAVLLGFAAVLQLDVLHVLPVVRLRHVFLLADF